MNFSFGIICAVGVLAAISIGFIAISPEETIGMTSEPAMMPAESSSKEPLPLTVTVSIPNGSSVPKCAETNECYLPFETTVAVGATVTWSNDDSAAHTVTSGNLKSGSDDIFDSGIFVADSVFKVTFDDAGTYDYYCIVHPWMTGTIDVI